MTKLSLILNKAFKLFREGISLNFASMITIITVLFIYSMFAVMSKSADSFLKEIARADSMRIYLKSTDKAKVDKLLTQIADLEGAESFTYLTPTEAREYLRDSATNINYVDKIPAELFPGFVEIKIKPSFQDADRLRDMERRVTELENVDAASYGEKWIKSFGEIRTAMKGFIFILTILLTVSIGVIIFNTIRLSLFRYKDDIKIYNLVGATRAFIELPYVICSFIEITLAYIVSSGLVYVFLTFLNNKLLAPVGLDFIILPDAFYYLKIYLYLVVTCIAGSMLSVASFMSKVKSINES
jgi:cell division transport system permease protein